MQPEEFKVKKLEQQVKEQKQVTVYLSILCATIALVLGVLIGIIIPSRENKPTGQLSKLEEIYQIIASGSLYDISEDELLDGAIDGMTDSVDDPFTFYTSTIDEQGLGTTTVGIGITRVPYGGNCLIVNVMTGSPAFGHLLSGDIIYRVGQIDENGNEHDIKDLNTMSHREWSAECFQGEEGTKLKLYFTRNSENREVVLTRRVYNETKVFSSVSEVNGKTVAYIELTTFLGLNQNGETEPVDELSNALKSIKETYQHIDSLVIDLSDNGGGYVQNFVNCMSLFVDRGTTVMKYRYRDGRVQDIKTSSNKYERFDDLYDNLNIVIDGSTASASESFALALKDLCGATIIGSHSYGKGVAQNVYVFSDGSVLRYTIAEVLPPVSQGINNIGITPDVIVGYQNREEQKLYNTYVLGVKDNYELTVSTKNLVLSQINVVLQTDFTKLEEAVKSFQERFNLEVNGEFNKITADYLQMKIYDLQEEIYAQTIQAAKEYVNA